MKNSEVPMMALRRAVQICGGLDALGDKLNTSTHTLEAMINGDEAVPDALFRQTVGLLLEATATRAPKRTPDSNEGGRKGPRN
jgi:hypothetical protein